MDIQTVLRARIAMFEGVKHPALLERFIDRNGARMEAQPFTGRRMTPKMCFKNCIDRLQTPQGRGLLYAEGYFWRKELPIVVHHAWLATSDGRVVDPTIDRPEEGQYLGITLPAREATALVIRAGSYSVLDPGRINFDFIFERDPGLREFVPEGVSL